jgi:hypothetical protein
MAENPTSVMPDFPYQWNMKILNAHSTLVKRTKSGREQRMGYYPITGYPVFGGDTTPLNQVQRWSLLSFMDSVRGKLFPFYWFRTEHANFYNVSLGTVSGVTSLIVPFKNIIPTLDEKPTPLLTLTVGGVSKSFTITEGAGTYGQARLNATSGTWTGAVVGTFAARAMLVGRFDVDESEQNFMQNAANLKTSFVVRIQGL